MHEFRRFIQKQLDDQGLRQADLVTRSGLTRSHVSKLMRDQRDHLGQMPDSETLEALAKGFGIPVARVRIAAARSLAGYADDGHPLSLELGEIPTDALLNELKRRIHASSSTGEADDEDQEPRTQEGGTKHGGTGGSAGQPGAPNTRAANGGADKVTPFRRRNQGPRPDHEMPGAASERVKEKTDTPDFEPGS